MDKNINDALEQCTIYNVVCCYCSKEIKTSPVDLSGELMHYDCANKAYIERCGDEGCVTYDELQECIP